LTLNQLIDRVIKRHNYIIHRQMILIIITHIHKEDNTWQEEKIIDFSIEIIANKVCWETYRLEPNMASMRRHSWPLLPMTSIWEDITPQDSDHLLFIDSYFTLVSNSMNSHFKANFWNILLKSIHKLKSIHTKRHFYSHSRVRIYFLYF
jgi:hypothetical protein